MAGLTALEVYGILTHDGDTYLEHLDRTEQDIAAVRFATRFNELPVGVPPGDVYRFAAEPGAADLRDATRDLLADFQAFTTDRARAAGVPFAAPATGCMLSIDGTPPAGFSWQCLESAGGVNVGASVNLAGRDVVRGGIALHHVGGSVVACRLTAAAAAGGAGGGDARILPLVLRGGKRVVRPWRDVTDMLTVTPLADWPITGPRTLEFCCRFVNRRGGGPLDWHRFWMSTNKLSRGDWGVDIHELAMRMLDRAGGYDGLDICNIACLGDLVRMAQQIEYAYLQEDDASSSSKGKGKGRVGLSDESSIFAGSHRETGDAMVAPELMDYVAKEVERDASIMKQLRKAREERRLNKSGNNNNKQ